MNKITIGWSTSILTTNEDLKTLACILIDAYDADGEKVKFHFEEAEDPREKKEKTKALELAKATLAAEGKDWLQQYNRAQEAEKKLKELQEKYGAYQVK